MKFFDLSNEEIKTLFLREVTFHKDTVLPSGAIIHAGACFGKGSIVCGSAEVYGVYVGEGAIIACGSVVKKDVPAGRVGIIGEVYE